MTSGNVVRQFLVTVESDGPDGSIPSSVEIFDALVGIDPALAVTVHVVGEPAVQSVR